MTCVRRALTRYKVRRHLGTHEIPIQSSETVGNGHLVVDAVEQLVNACTQVDWCGVYELCARDSRASDGHDLEPQLLQSLLLLEAERALAFGHEHVCVRVDVESYARERRVVLEHDLN